MSLTIAIATRGRPGTLRYTLEEMLPHIVRDDTTVLLLVDDDDKATIGQLGNLPRKQVRVSVMPREDTRGLKYDRALTVAPADLYLIGVDHTPITTPGFDQKFVDAAALFHDGIGVVCTMLANLSFPYLQAPTAKLCALMGYIQPPDYPFWFIDHHLDDIARMIGRYVPVDVSVHSNHRTGTTTGMRDVAFWADYYNQQTPFRRQQAISIINALDEPEEHKQILRASIPLIEQRSVMLNNGVMADAEAIETARGDPNPPTTGYLRAKSRAEASMFRKAA